MYQKVIYHKLAIRFLYEAEKEKNDNLHKYLRNIAFYYSIKYQKIQEYVS